MEILLLLIAIVGTALRIGIPILLIVFLVKGIKYVNARKNESTEANIQKNKTQANADLDEIEKELSALREDLNDTRR